MRVSSPLARSEQLVVEELEDEILVYDEQNVRAHCLTGAAARVWRHCDGRTSVGALAEKLDLDMDEVNRALLELETISLLDSGPMVTSGATRREFAHRAAKLGVAAGAVPLIYSVSPLVPAAAATPSPAQCLFYSTGDCNDCAQICGCCCCCHGCPNYAPSCKVCYPTSLCNTTNVGSGCSGVASSGGCSSGPNCSKTAPNNPPGCNPPCTVPCTSSTGAPCGCAGGSGTC